MNYAKRPSYYVISTPETRTAGLVATIAVHVVVFAFLFFNGYTIKYPPPAELGIEVALDEDVPAGIRRNPRQRVVPNPPIINDPGNSAPQSARVANETQSTRPTVQPNARPSDLSDFGDVEKPVEPKPEINQKALFQSTAQGTEDADNPHNIRDKSLFPGVGNSDESTRTANTPIGPEHRQMVTASLDGRSVVGSLPLPSYNSQNQGRVVVVITVDQNGMVTKANARAQGSTVQDARLWAAAEAAAKKARFNVKKDAPVFQTGTITYVFRLD